MRHHPLPLLFLVILTAASMSAAASEQTITLTKPRYDSPDLHVRLNPRTPNQIASFYIGRGFPPIMIKRLRETCYFTVGIRNKSKLVIWHDLSRWKFYTAKGPLTRYDRTYWKHYWQKIHAPLPSQSIFRWTLLPEQLDFQPLEGEGGNIILPRQSEPFTAEALFVYGSKQQGKTLRLRFTNLICAEDR